MLIYGILDNVPQVHSIPVDMVSGYIREKLGEKQKMMKRSNNPIMYFKVGT
jgi:hypothetical protein